MILLWLNHFQLDALKNTGISIFKFNILLETVSLEDKIGHLFVVNIEFNQVQATDRQMIYDEIFPPIIEKDLILEPNERSCFQLLELYNDSDENKPKSYTATKKSHSTLFSKKCIPLYLEDRKLLIERLGWVVTKINAHFTFEQSRYKKD